MEMEPGMPFEPRPYPRMLVGAVIVDDEMQIQILRGFDIYELQEPYKFLMPVSGATTVTLPIALSDLCKARIPSE